MTFSICARCPRTGEIGIGATTALQSVGKLACHAIPNVGAFASQALLNPYLAYDGLRLLQKGANAEQALERVLAMDSSAHNRQAGVIDRYGRTASWTGKENIPWAGHMAGHQFCTQGNRLAGPQVLEAVVRSMEEHQDLPLSRRLVLALQAGAAVGGDTEGERSANVMVFGTEEYPLCDLRIDDHDQPMEELERLYKEQEAEIRPTVDQLPKRADQPLPDESGLEQGGPPG